VIFWSFEIEADRIMQTALFSVIPPNCTHTKYIDPWKLHVHHGESQGGVTAFVHSTTNPEWKSKKGEEVKNKRYTGSRKMSETKKKDIESPPLFRLSSPGKKGFPGTGAHYGTFNEKPYVHVTVNTKSIRTKDKVESFESRNVMTSPGKVKGPWATPNIGFSDSKYAVQGPETPIRSKVCYQQ
jgi:hypothetical protein